MNNDLYNELNNLLSYLNHSKVVELVDAFYAKYENPAPALLLDDAIKKIELRLRNHTKKYESTIRELEDIIKQTEKNCLEELAELKELRLDLIKKTNFTCPKCGKDQELCSYTVLQKYNYEEPYSCTGGDRWMFGETALICPNCSVLLRTYKRQKDFHLPEDHFGNAHYDIYKNVIDSYQSDGSWTVYLRKFNDQITTDLIHNGFKYEKREFESLGKKLGLDFKQATSYGNFINI